MTTYSYDNLNRATSASYNVTGTTASATPTVNFYYDEGGSGANALGRLTHFADGPGSEAYQFDSLGRITQLTKTIFSTQYTLSYTYNLAGEMTGVTYPSGRNVTQGFDPIGRLTQVTSSGTNYVSNVQYNSASEPTGLTFGNGVSATYTYNSRLQLASLAYANGSGNFLSLAYSYGTADNGQIQSVTDNLDSTKTTSYTYDAWARLKTAQSSQWGLSWVYDRYGNRTTQTVTAGQGPSNAVTVDPTTNRLTAGYTYDAAGNMTNDGVNALIYNAENMATSNTGGGVTTTYDYDGNGLRVRKSVQSQNGAATVYLFNGSKVVAEYDCTWPCSSLSASSPTREYIYAGAQLVAKLEGSSTNYFHPDHLSVRAITDGNGNIVEQKGNFPFGENWYSGANSNKLRFTTYERDAESGNDFAMARYYVNRLGRFNSPDPLAGNIADPQSLNHFTYVRNDPINLVDPLGLIYFHPPSDVDYRPSLPDPPEIGAKDNVVFFFLLGDMHCILFEGTLSMCDSGGGPEDKGLKKALKELMTDGCTSFLTGVALTAAVSANEGKTLTLAEFSFVLSTASLPNLFATAARATYVSSSETPTNGNYQIVATANTATQTVTLYAPYSQESAQAQGQTIIHESMHLAFGFSDQQPGSAATGKTYGSSNQERARASADFQAQLVKHCH